MVVTLPWLARVLRKTSWLRCKLSMSEPPAVAAGPILVG